jgi:Bacterial Ig domain
LTGTGDNVVSLDLGDTVSEGVPTEGAGKIEAAGGEDRYVFQGAAEQSVVFEQLSAAASFEGWLRWEIKTPSGAQLLASFFKNNQAERKRLPETGAYTIRVFAGANNTEYVGAYSFRIYADVLARPDTFATAPGHALTMPMAKFLCNDSYGSADNVELDLPLLTSAQGGTLAKTPAGLTYMPKAGFTGADHFEYVLRGQLGGQSTSTATVHVFEGAERNPTVVSVFPVDRSTVRVCLLGAPDKTYNVQQSDDLGGWSNLDTISSDETGSMIYEYVPDPAGMRFYRFTGQQ